MKKNYEEIEIVLTEEELAELTKDYPWPKRMEQLLFEVCEVQLKKQTE